MLVSATSVHNLTHNVYMRKRMLTTKETRLPAIPDSGSATVAPAAADTANTTGNAGNTATKFVTTATVDGVEHAPFSLFIQLKPGTESWYPGLKRIWTYRGDTFTDQPRQMLRNLLRIIVNHGHKFQLMIIYDHRLPPTGDQQIFKIFEGTIRENLLGNYWENLPVDKIYKQYPNHATEKNNPA